MYLCIVLFGTTVYYQIKSILDVIFINSVYSTVADPGFPVGGAPTSDTYTFWRKHMRKRKKLILLGGARRRRPPWIRQCSTHYMSKHCALEINYMCHNRFYILYNGAMMVEVFVWQVHTASKYL